MARRLSPSPRLPAAAAATRPSHRCSPSSTRWAWCSTTLAHDGGSMKYVEKPHALTIGGMPPFTLEDFVRFLIANDERFNNSGSGIRASIRIESALKACAGKYWVELDKDDLS